MMLIAAFSWLIYNLLYDSRERLQCMSLCFPDTDTLYPLVVVARPDILKVPVISNVIPPRYGTPIEITYGGST